MLSGPATMRLIESLAAERNLTMKDLQTQANVHANTFSNWRTGGVDSPDTATLSRVAGVLNVPLSVLLEGLPPSPPDAATLELIEQAVARGVEAAFRRLREEGLL